jgi:hypothetical protein
MKYKSGRTRGRPIIPTVLYSGCGRDGLRRQDDFRSPGPDLVSREFRVFLESSADPELLLCVLLFWRRPKMLPGQKHLQHISRFSREGFKKREDLYPTVTIFMGCHEQSLI